MKHGIIKQPQMLAVEILYFTYNIRLTRPCKTMDFGPCNYTIIIGINDENC